MLLVSYPKTSLQSPMSWNLSSVFSSEFIVLMCMFRPLTHFELMFVCWLIFKNENTNHFRENFLKSKIQPLSFRGSYSSGLMICSYHSLFWSWFYPLLGLKLLSKWEGVWCREEHGFCPDCWSLNLALSLSSCVTLIIVTHSSPLIGRMARMKTYLTALLWGINIWVLASTWQVLHEVSVKIKFLLSLCRWLPNTSLQSRLLPWGWQPAHLSAWHPALGVLQGPPIQQDQKRTQKLHPRGHPRIQQSAKPEDTSEATCHPASPLKYIQLCHQRPHTRAGPPGEDCKASPPIWSLPCSHNSAHTLPWVKPSPASLPSG